MQRLRNNDNDDNGYKKRRIFDFKSVAILLAAIVGPTGVVGLMNAMTDPNITLQSRIQAVEARQSGQELKSIQIESKLEQRTMRVENYIKNQEEANKLRQKITDQELEHIKTLLKEIKDDVKVIKDGR
jgi:hypothetical protein